MAKDTQTPATKAAETGTPAVTNPWQSLVQLRREMDQMFENLSTPFMTSPFFAGGLDVGPFHWAQDGKLMPAADVVEKDKEYQVTLEAPGMDEKDIEITASNGMLTIKGEKREEKDKKEKDYFLSERRFGSFRRSFRLPDGVDADKIQAKFSKGLINVTLPKKPGGANNEKKIPIAGE